MRANAMEETYEEITVLNKPALFTGGRIDRQTVPVGLYAYDVRHDDDQQGIPCQIAKYIMVNHWGTILLTEPLKLPADGYLNIDAETDWNYAPIDESALPVGKIEYLSSNGTVGEEVEYNHLQKMIDEIYSDLNDGVPLSIVMYQYGDFPAYPMDWTNNLDCLPKGFRYEQRTDDRRKPCSTVKEFMQTYLPNQKIMMRPAPPKPKTKENER
jgi:hypothetical protein